MNNVLDLFDQAYFTGERVDRRHRRAAVRLGV